MSGSRAEQGGAAAVNGDGAALQSVDDLPTKDAVIGQGLKITGNLECQGDIVIAGVVEGKVTSRSLTVAQDATLKGSIRSTTVHVMGEVEGQINAASVRIGKTGLVVGDVYYDAVGMEDGGTIDGQMRRRQSLTA